MTDALRSKNARYLPVAPYSIAVPPEKSEANFGVYDATGAWLGTFPRAKEAELFRAALISPGITEGQER